MGKKMIIIIILIVVAVGITFIINSNEDDGYINDASAYSNELLLG